MAAGLPRRAVQRTPPMLLMRGGGGGGWGVAVTGVTADMGQEVSQSTPQQEAPGASKAKDFGPFTVQCFSPPLLRTFPSLNVRMRQEETLKRNVQGDRREMLMRATKQNPGEGEGEVF